MKVIWHGVQKSLPRQVLNPGQWIVPRYEPEVSVQQNPLVDEFGNNVIDENANRIIGVEPS